MSRSRRTGRAAGAVAIAAVAALVMTGCGAGTGGSTDSGVQDATGKFDWKRYDGKSINVMLNEHPWTDGVKDSLPEFEKLTGIKVNLQTYSEDLYMDKMEQAVRSSSAPGVYMLPMDDFATTQYDAGLMEPLTPMIENSSLTDASYDFEDFPAGLVAPGKYPAGAADAEAYEVPISTESYILFYNKDLVEKYLGGKVPATMEELIAASSQITKEADGDVYGSVVRGVRSDGLRDTVTGFVLNEWPLDRKIEAPYNVWFDGGWDKPNLTDDSIKTGLSDYAALIAAGPPNKFNIDWPDATSLFAQGKAAFFVDASVFGPAFEDTEQSSVAGKVGYALLPKGKVDGSTGVWSWGLAMPKNAPDKGAAWLFLQWATGKDMTAKLGAFTGGAPRQSSAEDPAYVNALNPEFVQVTADAASTARTTAVIRPNWKPGVLVIIDAVLAIANGQDTDEVLSSANDELKSAVK